MTDISGFGSRAQVAVLVRRMEDALDNRDGVSGNEADRAGSSNSLSLFDRQPILNRIKSAFEPGLSARDENARLSEFIRSREQAWGQGVSELTADAIPDHDRFRAEKAIALVRFGRTPKDVSEGFVRAAGTVNGETIAPREIFWQRWKPVGTPSGTVVVVAPGFLQTGRNFYEQVNLLNREGHDVVVMDQQWAGYSSGNRGGIDRGFGISRDVAAVTAFANDVAEREYKDSPHRVVIAGTSMGGGAGALGAITLNDAGRIQLEGLQMPKGVSAVLQAPYFDKTPGVLNGVLAALGRVPGLKQLELPSLGLPTLSYDPSTQSKLADHAVGEALVARAQAFNASDADLQVIRGTIESGHVPQGRIHFLHGRNDPLASPQAAQEIADALGPSATIDIIPTNNHVFDENAQEQRYLLDAVRKVTEGA